MSAQTQLFRGVDYLISRAKDASTYAQVLAQNLGKLGFSCHVPREGAEFEDVWGAHTQLALTAIIRYDFDRINSEFGERLEVSARVPIPSAPNLSMDYQKLVEFERQGVLEFPELVNGKAVESKL